MDIVLDLKNYEKADTIYKRTAARAIVKRGEQYLLIYSKYGDYKFPGGGVEEGETLEAALIREVQEETGYQVIAGTISQYGRVIERRKGEYEDVMEMTSQYFMCEVEEKIVARNLDDYEEEYDYQVIWLPISEAIDGNRAVTDLASCPWVIRDLTVMEYLQREKDRLSI